MNRAAYPALMLAVAMTACKKKEAEPQVVDLLEPTEVTVTDGSSDSFTFTVPPEAVSVTVTIEGESSASYALNSWEDDSGNTLVYDGWTRQEPQLCIGCDNRVAASEGTFAAIAPNNPSAVLSPGVHTASVTGYTQESLFSQPSPLTGPATVSVQAKVTGEIPATGVLNLNLYFTGAQGLTAATAPTDPTFTAAMDRLQTIYDGVGITIGELTYNDVGEEYQVIEALQGPDSDLMEMFELSNANENDGLNLFFVDTLTSPFGVILGIAGGIPGPPLLQGSSKSGVAIAIRPVDGVSSGWDTTMAHEMGHFLGLFHTSEQALFGPQIHDPLPDTPENDEDYLMFNTGSGDLLSEWQGLIMRSNPWVTHPDLEDLAMRSLITLVAFTFATVASAAEPTMDAVLDSIDVVPTAAQLEAVWPDARDRLIAVAKDPTETQWHRVRAASMLTQFPSPESKAALFDLASDDDVEVRRTAVHTAARTFGADGGPELVAFVQGMLEDPHPDVRSHAVRSLRWVDDPAAEISLRSITSDELRPIALHTLDRRAVRLAE